MSLLKVVCCAALALTVTSTAEAQSGRIATTGPDWQSTLDRGAPSGHAIIVTINAEGTMDVFLCEDEGCAYAQPVLRHTNPHTGETTFRFHVVAGRLIPLE